MTDRFERRLSPIERLWIVADRLCPPFANQMVLEGEGAFDEDAWRAAVARAGAAAPGSRLVLRGALARSRWVDSGEGPRLRIVDGDGWDGMGSEGAPFLMAPLPTGEGPSCEVLLIRGDVPRVAFRTHHGVMDGRGTMVFAEDVFRALRGEAPIGTPGPLGRVDDYALGRALDGGLEPTRRGDCAAPTGLPEGTERGVRWRRVSFRGPSRLLLPRAACALVAMARTHAEGPTRVDIPVDMRARRPDIRSTANLTGMVHVDVAPDDTPEDVSRALKRLLAERQEAAIEPILSAIAGVSIGFMTWLGQKSLEREHRRGRYMATAVLSNLGRLDMSGYEGAGFRARRSFFIPPGSQSTPFFLTLAGHDEGVELAATVPRVLGTGGRLERALSELVSALS